MKAYDFSTKTFPALLPGQDNGSRVVDIPWPHFSFPGMHVWVYFLYTMDVINGDSTVEIFMGMI